ncbi:MAG: hypothetical protein DI626_01055 [Micavibrio aeruginosavorus]|uniref:Uncharacterized protein n=1 Tax=Micavibrio aeruginosavorus TaxID=349221 RepID=A0A2W5C0B7_9BACT|nr:MAG: hypothetical protein DI626_01055 [Micavibrio aeruginosavorus]
MEKDRKFLFDVNIFDAPKKEDAAEDLPPPPPPPPTFSEEELAGARDISFEQGRQQGIREERESREERVATALIKIADSFSHLFAAEKLRENEFEKESLRLTLSATDLLFPLLQAKTGRDEVRSVIEKTLADHRKTKEITIYVPSGMKGEIETLMLRLRENETDEVLWRVIEDSTLAEGDCRLEWSDGGAVRDTEKAARAIRRNIEMLLGGTYPVLTHNQQDSDGGSGAIDVSLTETAESAEDIGESHER